MTETPVAILGAMALYTLAEPAPQVEEALAWADGRPSPSSLRTQTRWPSPPIPSSSR